MQIDRSSQVFLALVAVAATFVLLTSRHLSSMVASRFVASGAARVHATHDPCVLCPGTCGWPSSGSGPCPDQFLESSRRPDQAAEQGMLVVPGTPRRHRRAPAAAINPLCPFSGAVLELCAPTLACTRLVLRMNNWRHCSVRALGFF